MSKRLDARRRSRPYVTGRMLVAALLALGASWAAPEKVIAQQVPEPTFTPMTVRPALTNVPEVQEALMAAYPPALRDAGVGGAPVAWLYIGTDGTVQATRIAESSGLEALDAAAQQVARAMRFSPARNGNEIIAVWVQLPIRFRVAN